MVRTAVLRCDSFKSAGRRRPSAPRSWCLLLVLSLVLPLAAGCEDGPPTFKDLIGQGEKEEAAQPPPTPTQPVVRDEPEEPEEPDLVPAEVIAEFRKKKPRSINDKIRCLNTFSGMILMIHIIHLQNQGR